LNDEEKEEAKLKQILTNFYLPIYEAVKMFKIF